MRQADSVSPAEGVQDRRPAQKGFRPDIEGLRAVAVLAVVLFHAEVPGLGGGFVGVDVFFVISGFLITGLLGREVDTVGTVRLRRFYGARARRLLPASAAVGVVTAIGAAVLLPPLQARTVMGDGIASALYVGNYRFVLQGVDYSAPYMPPSPFQHYWSLGVEEQFYLVWPAMIIGTAWLIRRRHRHNRSLATSSESPYLVVLAVVVAVSLALSLVVTYWAPFVAFFSLPTRAWQLGLGGLVALTAGHWRRLRAPAAAIVGWGGLSLILVACTLFGTETPYPGTAALLPALGAALVIGAGCAGASQGCGRVLALSPMRAVGRVSYSWYLWHWPVLVLAPPLLGHPLGLAGRLAAVLLSAGLAVLTLHLIENPLRFAAPVRRSPSVSLALGGAATAAAVCVGVVLLVVVPTPVGHGAPAAALTDTAASAPASRNIDPYDAAVRHAFEQVQAAIAASSADAKPVPSNLNPPLADAGAEIKTMYLTGCMRNAWQVRQPDCATGDTASPTTVAVVGDSNGAMWNPAFRRAAEQRRWRLEMLTKASCPLQNLPMINPQLRREYTACEQWRAQIVTRLRAEHPRLVVVSMWRGYGTDESLSGLTSYNPAWIDGLSHLVRELRGTGAKVLVLGPIPDPHSVVPICLSAHLDDATACSAPRSAAVNESGAAAESAATEAGGGEYADVTEAFCTAQRCPVVVGNTLVYLDANHLTAEYARLLAPVIGALADRALAHG